jgi:hypothetical protein
MNLSQEEIKRIFLAKCEVNNPTKVFIIQTGFDDFALRN